MPKFALDFGIWENLKYHFSYSVDLAFWGSDSAVVSNYYLSGNNNASHTSASKSTNKGTTWQIENTLTYDKTFGKHSVSVVLGQSALRSYGDYLGGSRWHLVNVNKPSIDYATGSTILSGVLQPDASMKDAAAISEFSVYGGNNVEHRLSSLFARVSYNYDERYMFQATVRRDGSSRFGTNNKYGIFPSFSAGWNITNEKFMEETRSWLSNLKFRASWGKNGNDNIGDVKFNAKANASYLHNELINLGNDTGYLDYDGIQGISGGGTRGSNGQPFPYFFGYKTDGVFQNMDEVRAYVNKDGNMIMPDAQPGDVRFVDVNKDGSITPDDRTNIGNGTPKFTYGLNLSAEWNGLDFAVFFQGVAGNKVFDATYRSDVFSGNFPSWMLGRWTGEGTSNKYPILKNGDATNWQVSDLYICDGSYLRIKNISLGYTLPKKLTQKISVENLRVFVMSENLATWTRYWGFDPEISSGGTSLGVDRGIYPQARTFTVGFNITF